MMLRNATEMEIQNLKNIFANDSYAMNHVNNGQTIFLDTGKPDNLLRFFSEEDLDNTIAKNFVAATGNGYFAVLDIDSNVQKGEYAPIFEPATPYIRKYVVPVIKKIVEVERPIVFDIPEANETVEVDVTSIPTEMQVDIFNNLPMTKNRMETMYHTKSVNTVMRKGWVKIIDSQYEITAAGVSAQSRVKIEGVDRRKSEFKEFKTGDVINDMNIDVKIDMSSIPTVIQRDILTKLPMTKDMMAQNYHGKSINSVLRNGWMVISGDQIIATDAGLLAKDRVHVKDPNAKRGRKPKAK